MKTYPITLTIAEDSDAGRSTEALAQSRGCSWKEAAMELLASAQIYRSDILAALHETMLGMHQAGVLAEGKMQEFDQACLRPEFLGPTATKTP